MAKVRVLVFISTLIIVGILGSFAVFYARGYRLDFKTFKFQPNGILVIKSEPDGASVIINGELKTATNATLSLAPGSYDVEVKKEGFIGWYKRITIEKEVVTQAEASLFKVAPSLSPITFLGAVNPVISFDQNKIAFGDETGLWVIDVSGTPLGFNRDPKKIADGDMAEAEFEFSPNGRQILLTVPTGAVYLLDSTSFTAQAQRVNVASGKANILLTWEKEVKAKNDPILNSFPPQISEIFTSRVSDLRFAPDQTMILYTASSSGELPKGLVRPLPGASTQKEERRIQEGQTYLYDIKEDRNFLISTADLSNLRWMPDSRHILSAEENKVTIMDYDGTNKQVVYSGAYVSPFAYPYVNSTKLLILTNLGSSDSASNLYSLTIK